MSSAAAGGAPAGGAPAGGAPAGALAAIDIGTNSFHLLVARPTAANRFEPVAREKEPVRLGSGSGDMKLLRPEAIDRGIAALERLRKVADIYDAEIHAVATSAVREAENRDEFIERARQEAGIEVEVVSGVEEARLIHLGVLQAVPVFDRQLLLVDIGGGSTELLVGLAGEVLEARSLKLGAIRLTDRFFAAEPLRKRDVEECRQFLRAFLAPAARELQGRGFEVAVGSSGTILNIAQMIEAGRGQEPGRVASNASFTAAELFELVKVLTKARTAKDRLKVPGLDPGRADIILGGAVLLEQIFAVVGIDQMLVSDFALREGIILDAVQRARKASLHHLSDIRARSVEHLAEICPPQERAHCRHASRLALELWEGLAHVHGLAHQTTETLEAAALLANVGLFVSHARHHLHSYYIIRNSELLTGFTEHEVELIAQVARYHRKSAPKPKHEEFARLSPADQDVVRKLAGILRVAMALDRSYSGVVRSLSCVPTGSGVTVCLDVDRDGGDASLEIYTAEANRSLLEVSLGIQVRFEVASR